MCYKDFMKEYIGCSDVAALVLAGCGEKGLKTECLEFSEDALYFAYIVKGNDVEIGAHYYLCASFNTWMRVYDDDTLIKTYMAEKINVYRAGGKGCIIQLIDEKL